MRYFLSENGPPGGGGDEPWLGLLGHRDCEEGGHVSQRQTSCWSVSRPAASQEAGVSRGGVNKVSSESPRNDFSTLRDETRCVPLSVQDEDGEESDGKTSGAVG